MASLLSATCTFPPSKVDKPVNSVADTVMFSIQSDEPVELDTKKEDNPRIDVAEEQPATVKDDATAAPAPVQPVRRVAGPQDAFTELITIAPTVRIDIRYATTDNFTKSKIYDCGRCYLRPEAARAIARAQTTLEKEGLGLKMFDCYRPAPYQQRLWDKVPNPDYVTPPAKGSMHSRGAAVDLTLVDLKTGKELDMGTPYDFFGPEAHTDNNRLPAPVLANRKKLRLAMEAVGFQGIRTEWWHFSYREKTYPLSEWVWPCNR